MGNRMARRQECAQALWLGFQLLQDAPSVNDSIANIGDWKTVADELPDSEVNLHPNDDSSDEENEVANVAQQLSMSVWTGGFSFDVRDSNASQLRRSSARGSSAHGMSQHSVPEASSPSQHGRPASFPVQRAQSSG